MSGIVTVKFFASCREQTGETSITIEIEPNITTTNDLIQTLLERYPQLQSGIQEVKIAINHSYIEDRSQVLKDRDEIALLPPISGG
jgi:molybdopterin converting factor subunit 1